MRSIGAVMRLAWERSSFMNNFAGSHFYLLGRCAFRAVRAVRLLRAVIQFFYEFLYYLALNGGCNLMFGLSVFWTVVSLSNIDAAEIGAGLLDLP